MDVGTLQSIGTVLAFTAFIGIVWWAYTPKNQDRFDEASQLPFAGDVAAKPEDKKDE